MFTDCRDKVTEECAALGVVAYFGYIAEISAEIEKRSRMHEASFPSLFVNKNFSVDGHTATYSALYVYRQDEDQYDNFMLLRCCLKNIGVADIMNYRFNFINDASLAFTQTFKNVNLQPLTLNKLSGIEFEFKMNC